MIIKILALIDDFNYVQYATKDKYWYSTSNLLKENLLKPHSEEYQIRYVSYPFLMGLTGSLELQSAFEDLCTGHISETRSHSFDLLWDWDHCEEI